MEGDRDGENKGKDREKVERGNERQRREEKRGRGRVRVREHRKEGVKRGRDGKIEEKGDGSYIGVSVANRQAKKYING